MKRNPKFIVLLMVVCLISFSCTSSQNKNKQKSKLSTTNSINRTLIEITSQQQDALDALNTLQVNTDEMDHIYSTYPNINQPCYPPDTSFEISQTEFLHYMEQFIFKHCKEMEPEIQNELAKASGLAQEKYKVLHCAEDPLDTKYENGLPLSGTWVLPNILDRRDVTLVW